MTGSHVNAPSPGPEDLEPSTPVQPEQPTPPERSRGAWRWATPVVILLSGSLFAVSAVNSAGTDLRPGRYADLASLVENEADAYELLQARVATLNTEVDELAQDVDDEVVKQRRREVDELRDPAGLVARRGEGVTVVLSDAPEDVLEQAIDGGELDLNRLVVHQQDIQAVVNAMWNGGASAVTIQGQRVVTTTGIKCEGNAVTLQGVPYPQPYTIQAVGDPALIEAALADDADVEGYRTDAERPEIAVGWDLSSEDDVEAPAYAGLLDITYAEPLR